MTVEVVVASFRITGGSTLFMRIPVRTILPHVGIPRYGGSLCSMHLAGRKRSVHGAFTGVIRTTLGYIGH